MKSFLLVGFVFLLRVAGAGESEAVGGLYLNGLPITGEQACGIMLETGSFHQLPSLSVVYPVNDEDTAFLFEAVAPQLNRVFQGRFTLGGMDGGPSTFQRRPLLSAVQALASVCKRALWK